MSMYSCDGGFGKDLMKQGKFTTSMNRKVCYDAGYDQALQDILQFVEDTEDYFDIRDLKQKINNLTSQETKPARSLK